MTVSLAGANGDVIDTKNLRWWNQTLSMATLGATENLMHEYAPLNDAEIGKYFFIKRNMPKRGTVAVIKVDAWMGAKTMKNVRIGNFNFISLIPKPRYGRTTVVFSTPASGTGLRPFLRPLTPSLVLVLTMPSVMFC